MENRINYFQDGGNRSWNKDCDPLGIDLLSQWMVKNKKAIIEIRVEYDPKLVEYEYLQAGCVLHTGGGFKK